MSRLFVSPHRLLCTLLLLSLSPSALAVAYCSLRDPVNTIYTLFPKADAYRSNVKTVGRDARAAVADQLSLNLHFNELGRHTLYVAQAEGATLGFVHARSESSRWGLTEFAWAITPELRIAGMTVQRSRDPELRGDRAQPYRDALIGLGVDELEARYQAAEPGSIAQLITASALKTLVITAAVWHEELPATSADTEAQAAASVYAEPLRLQPIDALYDRAADLALRRLELGESPFFLRDGMHAFQALDRSGQMRALIVRSLFDLENPQRELIWVIDADGTVRMVTADGGRSNHPSFTTIINYQPTSLQDCSSVTELAALELGVLARRHSQR